MIAWQTANTFQEQRDAACTAAAALWQYQSNGGIGQPADKPQGTTSSFKFASPYVWLSASYINWMKQTAPDWAEPVAALCSKIEIGIKEENWLRKAQDVALLLTSHEAEAPASIRAVFRYNVASSTFYKSLSTAYTDAVISDVQYRTLSEQGSQERASKERKEAIDRLRSAWTDFTTVLNSAGDLGQRDILMSMAGLPLGIVVRADALLAADRPAAGQPAAARVGYKADQICGKLGAIKDLFAPGAATALCVNQEAVDTKLLAFETLLETAFAASRTPEPKLVQFAREFATKPENVDMLSLVNNLNACIYFDSTQTGMYLPCGKDSKSRPVRLIGWMEQSAEKQNPKPDAVRVSMVR